VEVTTQNTNAIIERKSAGALAIVQASALENAIGMRTAETFTGGCVTVYDLDQFLGQISPHKFKAFCPSGLPMGTTMDGDRYRSPVRLKTSIQTCKDGIQACKKRPQHGVDRQAIEREVSVVKRQRA
jgi:hypothetical protein